MSHSNSIFVDYKAVKASVSILQILDRYGITEKLTRSNNSLAGVCHIHGGSNPTNVRGSFGKKWWNRFWQGEKGSMGGRIAIPIHNQAGQVVAYAGRWPDDPPEGTAKYRLPKAFRKSLELFNCHRAGAADAARPLVVVEGFFDCIKIWQAGYR